MSTRDAQSCPCGAKPVIRKKNNKKWDVTCPCCQRYYTKEFDTRDEAVSAWNNNIGNVGKSKKHKAR